MKTLFDYLLLPYLLDRPAAWLHKLYLPTYQYSWLSVSPSAEYLYLYLQVYVTNHGVNINPQHKIFPVLPSEKSDVDSAAGRKTPRLENQGLGCGGAIPAEAIYSTSPSRRPHTITGGSPEAMKVRLAAMVLQPPTRV